MNSTQDFLKEQIELEKNIDLVSCDHQLDGHGRRSRKWIDSPSSLSFSFLLRPNSVITLTTLEVSVILSQWVKKKFSKNLLLKWPNDLIDKNQKCGGIIIESHRDRYICGIGLNILPDKYQGILNGNKDIPSDFKKTWPQEFFDDFQKSRLAPNLVIDLWMKRCCHVEKKVKVTENKKELLGVFKGIGKHGEGLLKTKNGIIKVYNGSLTI